MENTIETGVEVGKEVGSTLSNTFSSFIGNLFGGFSLGKLIAAVLVLLICLICTRLILAAVERAGSRSRLDATLRTFLSRLLKAFLLALSILITASTLGVDVTSLIAVLGVASLGISLALQGTLSNLVGGILLLTAKPFSLGDMIESGSVMGVVQSIGLFYTHIATYDNKQIYVPNSTLSGGIITNYTATPRRILEMTFSASYDDPIEEVKAALTEASSGAPGLLPGEPILVVVNNYGDHAISYMVRIWVEPAKYFDAKFFVTEEVKRIFDARGIQMTYPHLNLHVDMPKQ